MVRNPTEESNEARRKTALAYGLEKISKPAVQGRLIQKLNLEVSLNGGDKVQIQRWLELTG